MMKGRAERFVDYNNHVLFEGLFDYFFRTGVVWSRYRYQPTNQAGRFDILPFGGAARRFMTGLIFRLAVLPISALIYVASRMTLVAPHTRQYNSNPAKALSMRLATALTLIAVGLLTPLFTPANLIALSGAIGSAAFGGIILGAVLTIGMATLLYAAKFIAQQFNVVTLTSDDRRPRKIHIAPKHIAFTIKENIYPQLPEEFSRAHHKALAMYANSKHRHMCNTYPGQPTYKPTLLAFEGIIAKHKGGSLQQSEYTQFVNNLPGAEYAREKIELNELSVSAKECKLRVVGG